MGAAFDWFDKSTKDCINALIFSSSIPIVLHVGPTLDGPMPKVWSYRTMITAWSVAHEWTVRRWGSVMIHILPDQLVRNLIADHLLWGHRAIVLASHLALWPIHCVARWLIHCICSLFMLKDKNLQHINDLHFLLLFYILQWVQWMYAILVILNLQDHVPWFYFSHQQWNWSWLLE